MSGLRIVLLEDNANDAELIQELLQADHLCCEIVRVQSRAEFEAALKAVGIDLILADYKLPAFDGLSALEVTLRERPEVPFILVSGTLGEELAVEALNVDGGVNPHINGGTRFTRTVNNEAPLTASVGVAGPNQNGSPMSLRLGSSGGECCSCSRSCRARS
ncbi:CheY-like chemotaxis protein [Paraburkholderia sp. Clong3]|uniref:response regulator n=1 Tax=Paraburkholderia sp. Clong3 TaxID=2991061 RepID=UPI003D1B4614